MKDFWTPIFLGPRGAPLRGRGGDPLPGWVLAGPLRGFKGSLSRISWISSLPWPTLLCHRIAGNDRVISRFQNSEQNGSLSPLRIPEGGEKITRKTNPEDCESMKQETRGFATLPRSVANPSRGLSSLKCSTNLCKENPDYSRWIRCVSAIGVRFMAGA